MGPRRHDILFTKCLEGLAIGGGEHDCHGHTEINVMGDYVSTEFLAATEPQILANWF